MRKFYTSLDILCLIFIASLGFISLISSGGGGGGGDGSSSSGIHYTYRVPEQINDGWTTDDLSATTADIELIEEMISSILRGQSAKIHSVLIILEGKLVLEEYFPGYKYKWNDYRATYVEFNRNTLHHQASATKSFVSALIGIALDQGLISGVDEKLFSFFPEYSHLNNSPQKDAITLQDTLTMTAGLEWDALSTTINDRENPTIQMAISDDAYAFVLSRNSVAAPGTVFNYNNGLAHLIGGVIKNVSGLGADEFAEHYLFEPLDIDSYTWKVITAWRGDTTGQISTSGGLALRPRDMAKFGKLFKNKGLWNGTRIISEQWVNESLAKHVTFQGQPIAGSDDGSDRTHYGYLWWWNAFHVNGVTYEADVATGHGGQRIYVFDALDLVVVFTGGDYQFQGGISGYMYLNDFILPALLPVIP